MCGGGGGGELSIMFTYIFYKREATVNKQNTSVDTDTTSTSLEF